MGIFYKYTQKTDKYYPILSSKLFNRFAIGVFTGINLRLPQAGHATPFFIFNKEIIGIIKRIQNKHKNKNK